MKKTNVLAIVGFGISLLSWFVYYDSGAIFFAIAGLTVSIISLVQIKEQEQKGKAFAILGIILAAYVIVGIIEYFYNLYIM